MILQKNYVYYLATIKALHNQHYLWTWLLQSVEWKPCLHLYDIYALG